MRDTLQAYHCPEPHPDPPGGNGIGECGGCGLDVRNPEDCPVCLWLLREKRGANKDLSQIIADIIDAAAKHAGLELVDRLDGPEPVFWAQSLMHRLQDALEFDCAAYDILHAAFTAAFRIVGTDAAAAAQEAYDEATAIAAQSRGDE